MTRPIPLSPVYTPRAAQSLSHKFPRLSRPADYLSLQGAQRSHVLNVLSTRYRDTQDEGFLYLACLVQKDFLVSLSLSVDSGELLSWVEECLLQKKNFRTFLTRKVWVQRRSRKRREALEEAWEAEREKYLVPENNSLGESRLYELILSLRNKEQELVKFLLEGFTPLEISQALGVPAKQIRDRLSYLRKKLRIFLEKNSDV